MCPQDVTVLVSLASCRRRFSRVRDRALSRDIWTSVYARRGRFRANMCASGIKTALSRAPGAR